MAPNRRRATAVKLPKTSLSGVGRISGQSKPASHYQDIARGVKRRKATSPKRYASGTAYSVSACKVRYQKFCEEVMNQKDWRSAMRDCDKWHMAAYFNWLNDNFRATKHSTMINYKAHFHQLYSKVNGRYVDTNDSDFVLQVIEDFNVSKEPKDKPILGIHDLMILLNYH